VFLYQETYYVRPGLQDIIDERVRSLHENHATNTAFVASDWMKYLGDGTTYLAFRLWQEQGVSFDAAQSEWMAEYNRTRPADAFIQPPDIDYYQQVEQSGSPGGAGFLVKSELQVAGRSAWPALEKQLLERLAAAEAFREYRLYRFMGGENRYLRAEFWENADAGMTFWRREDMREFSARLNSSLRRPPPTGYYEVLHQLGSARPVPIL
jgi:quinol monooxygenase YgiN